MDGTTKHQALTFLPGGLNVMLTPVMYYEYTVLKYWVVHTFQGHASSSSQNIKLYKADNIWDREYMLG